MGRFDKNFRTTDEAGGMFGFLPPIDLILEIEYQTRPGENVTALRGIFERLVCAIKIERDKNRIIDISAD